MPNARTPRATLIEAMARGINDWTTTPPFEWENLHPAARDRMTWAATAALDALLAALPGLGLRVVPVEPDKAMLKQVQENGGIVSLAYARAAWPDMVAAAPDALGVADE